MSSNLSIYRVKHRTPPHEMSLKEKQLLVAVEKAQTKMIETLISQGVCVNCKARVGTFFNHNLKLSHLALIDLIVIEK